MTTMALIASSPSEVLARTLWGEAKGEGRIGLQAVANVIQARTAHPRWWGRTISSVCLMPYQFSCWLQPPDGERDAVLAVTTQDPAFLTAIHVAALAMGGTLPDITNGADSYVNLAKARPKWIAGLTPCATIGRHTFYRTELAAPAAGRTTDQIDGAA